MSHLDSFNAEFTKLPLVAILRGLEPHEAVEMGQALVQSGISLLEVPLNSPQALQSITLLRQAFPQAVVGAGTVLTKAQLADVHSAGGQMVVSPNFDADVVRETCRLGLVSLPGILTPSEAFGALAAGAHGLKIFPAELASPAVAKALLAVLPTGTRLLPVGGIGATNMSAWRAAGVAGFGIGSSLFKPGKSAAAVADHALALVAAYQGSVRV